MILVRKGNAAGIAGNGVRIDEYAGISGKKVDPLEVWGNALGIGDDFAVQGFGGVGLLADDSVELAEAIGDGSEDMSLKGLKVLLNSQYILSIGSFLYALLMKPVVNSPLQNVGVIRGVDLATSGIE